MGSNQKSNDQAPEVPEVKSPILVAQNVNVYYGSFHALWNVNMEIFSGEVTAFIGPSGCGKSTFLRCLNRMNEKDVIPNAHVKGSVKFIPKPGAPAEELYADHVDPVLVRARIGIILQRPVVFPMSIYENVAYGLEINRIEGDHEQAVVKALKDAALWNEVKDRLDDSGLALSGGQQQRLCIARAIVTKPDVLLMDEPCSALDPNSTLQVEELMKKLKRLGFTVVLVTHNMDQASRVADRVGFFYVRTIKGSKSQQGYLCEIDETETIFRGAESEFTRAYVKGELV